MKMRLAKTWLCMHKSPFAVLKLCGAPGFDYNSVAVICNAFCPSEKHAMSALVLQTSCANRKRKYARLLSRCQYFFKFVLVINLSCINQHHNEMLNHVLCRRRHSFSVTTIGNWEVLPGENTPSIQILDRVSWAAGKRRDTRIKATATIFHSHNSTSVSIPRPRGANGRREGREWASPL